MGLREEQEEQLYGRDPARAEGLSHHLMFFGKREEGEVFSVANRRASFVEFHQKDNTGGGCSFLPLDPETELLAPHIGNDKTDGVASIASRGGGEKKSNGSGGSGHS